MIFHLFIYESAEFNIFNYHIVNLKKTELKKFLTFILGKKQRQILLNQ